MSKPLKWTTDSNGLLSQPVVHDAHLAEARYKGSSLEICVDDGQRKFMLILDGVMEANLTLWSGAIISQIVVWRLGDLSAAGKEMFDLVWKSLFEGQLADKDIDGTAHEIMARDENALIFVVFCSYGGTVACVAERLSVCQA